MPVVVGVGISIKVAECARVMITMSPASFDTPPASAIASSRLT